MTEQEQQTRCICCRCRSVFSVYDTVMTERRYGNIMIKEKGCPYCEGNFKKLDVPRGLDKFLYVNADQRYYNS